MVAGFAPGPGGMIADLADSFLYLLEGDMGGAIGASIAIFIGGAGLTYKSIHAARKANKISDTAKLVKNTTNALSNSGNFLNTAMDGADAAKLVKAVKQEKVIQGATEVQGSLRYNLQFFGGTPIKGKGAKKITKRGSSSVNLSRPGEDGFIGPLTRPEHHFIFGEGIGPKQKGVVGAHNMNYFEETLARTGFGVDDLKIGSPVPHPTINGIYSQRYTVPAYDGKGNFIGFKNIKDPKTIYDPTVISNRQMLDWGWEAMDNGVVSGRIIEGSASNGLKFRGYIGDDGSVTNFFPIFE